MRFGVSATGPVAVSPLLVNLGAIRGFNPQPDPPSLVGLGGPDTLPSAKGIIIIGG